MDGLAPDLIPLPTTGFPIAVHPGKVLPVSRLHFPIFETRSAMIPSHKVVEHMLHPQINSVR